MLDSNFAGPVVAEPGQDLRRAGRRRDPAQRCRFCTGESAGDVVDAGGDIGRVHRSCFIEWDRSQEALEMGLSMPDLGAFWCNGDIAGDEALAKAA